MVEVSDPIMLFMVFLMLCFAGVLYMLYAVMRALETLTRAMQTERSAVIGALKDIESAVQRVEHATAAYFTVQSAVQDAASHQAAARKAAEDALRSRPERETVETLGRGHAFSPGSLADSGDLDDFFPADANSPSRQSGREHKVWRLDGIEPLVLK